MKFKPFRSSKKQTNQNPFDADIVDEFHIDQTEI